MPGNRALDLYPGNVDERLRNLEHSVRFLKEQSSPEETATQVIVSMQSDPHSIVGPYHTATGSPLDVVGLTATDTLGILTPSADPGAAESLLKSTPAGGLTLQSLAVEGSVDITIGDLTVGANVLLVDVSGQRVGINTAPDPQFALDIAGNIRWSGWGVGKMAIQLEGALLIAHYDGPEPYESDFTGVAIGHRGQPAPWTGGVIFRPGKFGSKAAQIAGVATNQIHNPSFENNVTDSWAYGQGGTGGSRQHHTTRYYIGGASCKLVASDAGGSQISSNAFSVADGQTVTAQCRIWRDAAVSHNVRIWDSTSGTTRATASGSSTGEWEWITLSWTNNTGASATVDVRINNTAGDGASAIWADAVQAELSAFASPYLDGSLDVAHPNGTTGTHSWSGAEHNSTSTRNAARLHYNTEGNLKHEHGTVMAWAYVEDLLSSTTQFIFHHSSGGSNRIYLYKRADGNWGAGLGSNSTLLDSGVAAVARTWVHLALTWDGSTGALYVNGVQRATASYSDLTTLDPAFSIGITPALNQQINGYIDDLVILNRAASVDEIRAVYESNAPVFAETSTFHWQAPGPAAIWVDEEGLYGRDEDGAAIIGLSTVDGKSWGGQTLDKGDFLWGRGNNYMLYDNSVPGLTISGELHVLDNSVFEGVMTIDTAGEIRQGSGALGTDFTGLRVWNDGGIGRIGGYNADVLQWYADTDGILYAGAGDVLLGAGGIVIEIPTSTPVTGSIPQAINFEISGANQSRLAAYQDLGGTPQSIIEISHGSTGEFGIDWNPTGEWGKFFVRNMDNAWIEVPAFFSTGIAVGRVTDPTSDGIAAGVIEGTERTADPATPAADAGRLYFYDNAGTQELRARFGNGTIKTIVDDT